MCVLGAVQCAILPSRQPFGDSLLTLSRLLPQVGSATDFPGITDLTDPTE